MGSASSCFIEETPVRLLSKSSGRWRKKLSKKQSRKVYTLDGTIPSNASDGVLALRVFLEDPASIVKFAEFSKSRGKLNLLLCWIEVLEYKNIEGGNGYKLSQGSHIYHKYFKEDAVVQLGITSTHSKEECDYIEAELVRVEADSEAVLSPQLFDRFGQECLMCIYAQLFLDYRQSKFYDMSLKILKQQTNHVFVDDFEYMQFLGQGSFGLVVHCKKKSTGKHYAMKIQTKIGLLRTFSDSPQRVTYEKEALAKCHHPFIISMDYAFQTPELAIVVTALGTGESLHFAEPISEERTIFYAAEIVLALNHIHQLGMIYRDLKPANVLLNADGHIQLVDMGGVVDVNGKTLGNSNSTCYSSYAQGSETAILFAPASGTSLMSVHASGGSRYGNSSYKGLRKVDNMINGSKYMSLNLNADQVVAENSNSPNIDFPVTQNGATVGAGVADVVECNSLSSPHEDKRGMSVFGTSGFMAPEMLALLHQDVSEAVGYTKAVDYWSLGVLIYVLLTGKFPFRNKYVAGFVMFADDHIDPPEYALFRQELTELSSVSDTCKEIVLELLTIDEKKRLGSAGIASVKNHPWFGQNKFGMMPWSLLGKKLVKPPESGQADFGQDTVFTHDVFPSFRDMLIDFKATGLTDHLPTAEQQKFFNSWDYVAPHVLKVEVGAEEEDNKYADALEKLSAEDFASPLPMPISDFSVFSVSEAPGISARESATERLCGSDYTAATKDTKDTSSPAGISGGLLWTVGRRKAVVAPSSQ